MARGTTDYVTRSELDARDLQRKEEERQARHKVAEDMQQAYNDIDTLQSDKKVTDQIIKTMIESVKEIKDIIKAHIDEDKQWKKDMTEAFDRKYASKLTETLVFGMIGLILTAFAGALIALVIK